MKLGVCYYPEHWPEDRWASDARRMREIGISFVRIAEFAWSRIEPDPGPPRRFSVTARPPRRSRPPAGGGP